MGLFLRLLEDEDKGAALLEMVRAVAAGEPDRRVFEVPPASFEQVPGAPFAYWVGESTRRLFVTLPPFESSGRNVAGGMKSGEDQGFLRLWWEISLQGKRYRPFAKGGRTRHSTQRFISLSIG
ncbi:hypothetical protein CKO31_11195 [Thiohalocapsa halophila]|uniref:Uncharacterized protein n=1 Tax=Thiohalocapsa halophila TaxID=69359 RepID=A0ABS1CHB8_9GAMM|nr:hypothetical protein [Thiohalocapsa halophila]MBK1631294.1 hypothetical protein [Thiohalocapsa halophila]